MKRVSLKFVASLLLVGFIVLALSAPSFADDKKDEPKAVKFACTRHGPKDMQLTLAFEKGDPRKIEIIGTSGSNTKWTVMIDGKDVTPANMSTIKVHPKDTITWSITGGEARCRIC